MIKCSNSKWELNVLTLNHYKAFIIVNCGGGILYVDTEYGRSNNICLTFKISRFKLALVQFQCHYIF